MGLYGDNGKENGKYRDYRGYIGIVGYILGLYRDNGKENGNCYNGFILWLILAQYWSYFGSSATQLVQADRQRRHGAHEASQTREPGAGNPRPVKRQPFPEIKQEVLDDALDKYVREIGCKEPFNM